MLSYSKIINRLNSHYRTKFLFKAIVSSIIRVLIFNKGIAKKIGSKKVILDCYFAFSDYESFGDGHNNGFNKLLEISQDKRVVLDVGAHIGLCAIPLSSAIAAGGKVYAFEPSAANLRFLKRNIAYNDIDNIEVSPYLVGSESNDAVAFHESRVASAMNSVVAYKTEKLYKVVGKKQISLDDFCSQNNIIPEVIKIDVEGAEIDVLNGAKKILKRFKPAIMLSVHPRHLSMMGCSVNELVALIKNLGYQISDMDGKPTEQLKLAEYILEPLRF